MATEEQNSKRRERYLAKKDEINIKRRVYEQANKEIINAKRREYYASNPDVQEKGKERMEKYREENREEILLKMREYNASHKEQLTTTKPLKSVAELNIIENDTTTSMYQKYKLGEITCSEYNKWLENKKASGITSMHTKMLRGEISLYEYQTHRAQQNGFESVAEYQDSVAQNNGMKDRNEMHNKNRYDAGTRSPMSENKECASYLGVHIAERVLSHVFENVTRMPNNHMGFDFVCKKGYRIDVKSACLNSRNMWRFSIEQNKVPDYFLLLAFDNRTELNPMHIWLIKGTDIVGVRNKSIMNNQNDLRIYANSIFEYTIYEVKDKLDQVIACCEVLK